MDNKLTVFRIGQIVNTQGLKGEVRVYPYTDDINRFDDLEYFYLDKGLNNKYEVERVRYKGNMVIMKIKGIDSIELAQKLKTKNMYIGRDQGKELEEDEFFVADLIGLDVFTVDGEKVGVVKDVLQHAINDVYVVNNGEKEYLIPSIEKFVPTIDLEENKIFITSQNHGYYVSEMPENMEVTHINLNDNTVEGMRHKELPIYSVQYHPEACPGPKDNDYIFDKFLELV